MATMGKHEKLLLRIVQGSSDRNIKFEDLRKLLLHLGFEERIRGSHHLFRKRGVEEMINLQKDASNAKYYQVRQVRAVLLRYRLGDQGDV
jgi:virulence-associated protein VapD